MPVKVKLRKKMEYRDYYQILGVDRKASKEEIKQVYRKLALQYHPDRNPGDTAAEEKFKEINEAYQVLGDDEKRAHYDRLGSAYQSWQRTGGAQGGFDWGDWFTGSPGGGGVRVDMGDLNDILGGGLEGIGGFSEFFSRIFGGLGGFPQGQTTAGPGRRPRQQVPASPYQQQVTISLHESYQGATRMLEANGRRLEVKIPVGARTGTKVRVAGIGPRQPNGQKGDLFLVIKVADDPRFEREGDDLNTEVKIDLFTALLGGEVKVSTLAGEVMLTIPPGTQPGQTFRLGGRGMPKLKRPTEKGDLFVSVKVEIPRQLTEQQQELVRELAKSHRR
jgi:curved DNA-binding protein